MTSISHQHTIARIMWITKHKEIIVRYVVFLLTASVLSYYFYDMSRKLYKKYKTDALSFTIDSAYLDWNTSFPSISLCQVFNGEKNWDLSEKYFGEARDKRLDDFLTEISFFTGACYTCELCDVEVQCPNDFKDILSKFRAPCKELITNCSWNDEPFDCCKGFLPLQTETGECFTINSALTTPKYGKRLISNRVNGPGKLKMNTKEDIQIYIHHSEDIPFAYGERELRDTILWGSTKEIILRVNEIVNDPDVVKVAVEARRCKFPEEVDDGSIYDIYSFSTCYTNCYNDAQLHFCNCSHHLMPRGRRSTKKVCDYKGLMCLTENFMKISETRKTCNCLAACNEFEYKILYNSNEELGSEDGTEITVSMQELPTYRYFRRLMKSDIDISIAIGGIFGFYSGLSIIGIIEILWKMLKSISNWCKIPTFKKEKDNKKKEQTDIKVIS